MTEEDVEEFFEDVERIDKTLSYIMEISGVFLRTMSDAASESILTKLVQLYAKLLANVSQSKEYELVTALCFFCDCLEHGQPALLSAIIDRLPEKYMQVMA